ncbi:P-loop containing nucleoside triphosphate hydrolase protein [Boletus coccyginus]|nr:P-loop containing nucleoside triphosphate hydrolase protein [Boletus coccyginus]
MVLAQCRDRDGWRWTSRRRDFDLSLCAEEGVLIASLLAVLAVAALARIRQLSYAPNHVVARSSRWRLWAKLTLLGLAFFISLATLAFVLTDQINTAVQLPYALEPIALLLALCLTRLNHLRTRSSSTILLLFWPCYAIALSVWTRSYVQTFPATPLVPLKWAALFLGLLSFALECISPDDSPDPNTENPTLTANVFSIWSFAWLTPLLRKGSQAVITEDDLPTLVPRDESANLGTDLQRALEKHSGLWTALFVAYGVPYLGAGLLKLLQDSLAFVQPLLLRAILSYISEYQDNKGADVMAGSTPLLGYAIAILMFAASMAQTVILHQYFQICFETGMRIRAGLVTAIYKKALVLSSDERGRATGDIVNLMSVDTTRMQDLCTYGIIAISGPYQITLAFVSLYNLLGWSAFVGVAIMVFSIPLNTFIARILKKMQEKQMKNRDKRTRLMSELLANIKSIKLYAWEYAFIRRILHVRNDLELKMLRKIGITTAMNTTLWGGIPLIVAFSSFATASVFSTRPLTADVIFPAISLFMLLQFPLAMFSQVTSNVIEALVSVKRLSEFLHAEELQEDAVKRLEKPFLSIGDEVLSIKDGEFQWTRNAIQPALEGINLTVRKGELVGILGRVGAGKSSLLSAIIGDMRKMEGEIVLSGTVAYASQNAWILSATVRDNILFSHAYDESFYNLVIEACALKPDLAVLPQGDMTEVGEKGITLSGGQRARVALARAVYARADLVLLDDVLAAVDSHVARHVFDNVIGPQGLLATKARILVTNSIAYLKHFDQLAYIRRGIILECGSYRQLVSDPDSAVRKLIQNHATNGSSSGATSGAETPAHASGSGVSTPTTSDMQTMLIDGADAAAEKIVRRTSFNKAVIAPLPSIREATSTGLSKEHSEKGRVKKEVYFQYLQAASKAGFYFFLLATALGQMVSVMATYTLRLWGESNRQAGENAGLRDPYLLGYGFFNLMSIVCGATGGLLIWVLCSLRSSKYLHDAMLDSVMRAPLSFFEMTPTGRILNLFSRDIYVVDLLLGRVIQNLARTTATTASIVLVIGFSFPPFIIAVIPLSWFYYRVTVYYLSTSRELKRLDAASKSPIFAWFSESLSGVSTIRAYNQQGIFIAQNEHRVDRNQMCYLPSTTVNRWLAVRLEFVGSVIILCTAILSVAAVATSNVDAGLVGMVLSYALNTTGALNWLVRSASEVEQNVVSVERITHYANDLPSEAPRELPDSKPTPGWPGAGEVEFREYSMRYRPELDLVLKEISLTIKPKEKIGIVGRTGAGKSSLLLALFRIIEAASGKILIDGVDISTIGLHDLRSVISIVPQSPDLFEGTLRENIDPVGEYQDADIWAALEHANLKPYVESLPEGLDAPVQEGGSSLSAGQRQLLCFARALLRKSKVLVLDEATSAVDLDTDRAIQEIIRGPLFHDVTILTIAHRLNTIIESTRVLVLDQGRVAEFDVPAVLLADKSSRFYSMALEAGLVQEDGEVGQDGRVRQAGEESGSADEVQEQAGGEVDE